MELHWVERPASGPAARTLLLIPGVGMSYRAYAWLVPLLPTQDRVLIVDPPGSGDSETLEQSMDPDAQARILGVWMRAEGVEHAHVVGHSLGAILAARLAAHRPDAVQSLTALSPSPDGTKPRLYEHIRGLVAGTVHEAPRTLIQAVRDYVTARPQVLAGFTDSVGWSAQRVLAGVTAPVLVARGAYDRAVTGPWCLEFAAIGGGPAHVVPGAGHGLPQQQPQIVAALLDQAIARAEAAAPPSPSAPRVGFRTE